MIITNNNNLGVPAELASGSGIKGWWPANSMVVWLGRALSMPFLWALHALESLQLRGWGAPRELFFVVRRFHRSTNSSLMVTVITSPSRPLNLSPEMQNPYVSQLWGSPRNVLSDWLCGAGTKHAKSLSRDTSIANGLTGLLLYMTTTYTCPPIHMYSI